MSEGVAVLDSKTVSGVVRFVQTSKGVRIQADFTKLPPGLHGFHIHKAGDLREGCTSCCDHWNKGAPSVHGGPPSSHGARHTGDLGNISMEKPSSSFFLRGVRVEELYGRSMIVHADPDDLGKGDYEDSATTGHSGARIACAIIGRAQSVCSKSKTRRQRAGARLLDENKTRISKRQNQIIHCISQLKRFTNCFKEGDMKRLLQFGYNLGRLQELCGETAYPEIWWKPFEMMINEKKWEDLHLYLDELRDSLHIVYDEQTVKSTC
jgi:Cu-Zn family superoxide dismutase